MVLLRVWQGSIRVRCATEFNGIQQNVPYIGGPEGSCWCGDADGYCLCTPSLSVDVIIESSIPDMIGIVMVNRTKPPYGYSLPGGYVEIGETAEAAAVREVREETGLTIQEGELQQVLLSSDPRRDVRRHGATMLFSAITSTIPDTHGDETSSVRAIPFGEIGTLNFAFGDQKRVIETYLGKVPGNLIVSHHRQAPQRSLEL
eukprot:TRINITY_DN1179_c0_g4_i1.p1 TRINITY_DN1179_c0_g4~~TRINITY_DN1179_c0_g4_i1.p1  ORF type:complete len:232 (+),score=24.37 TRINITY_DN1179_c0_g4_i1:92-697(+)